MAKLALLGFSVVLGAGACVTEDTNAPRVFGDEVASTNVINEMELPTIGDDNVDPRIVVVTGLDWPGRAPLHPNMDLRNLDEMTLNPNAREFCAQVSTLPGSDVCSALCDPDGFTARVFGGSTGCTTQTCQLPNGATATVDVCN